jgi:hypothetical protein
MAALSTSRRKQMTKANRNSRGGRILALAGLVAAFAAATSPSLGADANQAGGSNGLAGAWTIQVTLRNCSTNAPMGTVSSLVTFHRGGTISESVGSLTFAPGQRSPGHGTWTHLRGRQYLQRMVAMVLFDSPANLPGTPGFDPTKPVSPGFQAGWQTVTHTIRMIDADNIESSGTNEFFDSLAQTYRTGCSTAVGRRFE